MNELNEGMDRSSGTMNGNRSGKNETCSTATNHGNRIPRTFRRALIGNSLIWAALMIATALVLTSFDNANEVLRYLLPVIYVPLWFASDQLLRSVIRQSTEN